MIKLKIHARHLQFFTILIFYCISTYSQKDTLRYTDLIIKSDRNKRVIYFKNDLFTGVIKSVTDDKIYFEKVVNGIVKKSNFQKIKKVAKPEEIYRTTISNFSKQKAVLKDSLTIKKVKIIYPVCTDCDIDYYFMNVYSLKNKLYSGFVKKNDSLFFIFEGEIKNYEIFHNNKNPKEFCEIDKDEKNGLFKKFDENGKLIEKGTYLSNSKKGRWEVYDENNITVQHFDYGSKQGVWFYYKDKKLVKCEFYISDVLDYYYTATFSKNKEIRFFYKNNKKYAIVEYIDGHIDRYTEVK